MASGSCAGNTFVHWSAVEILNSKWCIHLLIFLYPSILYSVCLSRRWTHSFRGIFQAYLILHKYVHSWSRRPVFHPYQVGAKFSFGPYVRNRPEILCYRYCSRSKEICNRWSHPQTQNLEDPIKGISIHCHTLFCSQINWTYSLQLFEPRPYYS